MMGKWISLEGLPATYKSTLIEILQEEMKHNIELKDLVTLDEPEVQLSDDLLERQRGFFQAYDEQYRRVQLLKATKDVITAFSIFSVHVYADLWEPFMQQQQAKDKLIRKDFSSLRREFTPTKYQVPDVVLYLTANPSVVLDRIRRRGRQGEEFYTLDHMIRLDGIYRQYLAWFKERGSDVIVFPTDGMFPREDKRDRAILIHLITQLLKEKCCEERRKLIIPNQGGMIG